ncbi:MAG: shikimate kinase, partial [Candidatus Omnitrophica bacterium]|nr:shikimate kinase [Candidatus Omnitrophota bacterium]
PSLVSIQRSSTSPIVILASSALFSCDRLVASPVVICLTADEGTVMERTKKYKHRPLLNVEDPKLKIRMLLAKRAPLYAKADHVIDTGKFTARQVVEKIMEIAK